MVLFIAPLLLTSAENNRFAILCRSERAPFVNRNCLVSILCFNYMQILPIFENKNKSTCVCVFASGGWIKTFFIINIMISIIINDDQWCMRNFPQTFFLMKLLRANENAHISCRWWLHAWKLFLRNETCSIA
jgi:hypothetical protein